MGNENHKSNTLLCRVVHSSINTFLLCIYRTSVPLASLLLLSSSRCWCTAPNVDALPRHPGANLQAQKPNTLLCRAVHISINMFLLCIYKFSVLLTPLASLFLLRSSWCWCTAPNMDAVPGHSGANLQAQKPSCHSPHGFGAQGQWQL